MLTVLFHELGGEAGFQSHLIHKLFVIEGDTKLFRNHTAHTAAAAAKLTADGNDFLFHRKTSFR